MDYDIHTLANMAGVSTRTLRYYDQRGLLVPGRIGNGYRVYGRAEVDRLQQILLYRELDLPLKDIQKLLSSGPFDAETALRGHLSALTAKRDRLQTLISNVEKTIKSRKGEIVMSDNEKFQGFLNTFVDENEKKYGAELRETFGNPVIDQFNAKVRGMTREQYDQSERLRQAYEAALKEAYADGGPESARAQKACDLHRKWLCFYWPQYNKEAHIGVTETYCNDPRFTAYYDRIAPGCAAFLRDAVAVYVKG